MYPLCHVFHPVWLTCPYLHVLMIEISSTHSLSCDILCCLFPVSSSPSQLSSSLLQRWGEAGWVHLSATDPAGPGLHLHSGHHPKGHSALWCCYSVGPCCSTIWLVMHSECLLIDFCNHPAIHQVCCGWYNVNAFLMLCIALQLFNTPSLPISYFAPPVCWTILQ